MGLSLDVIRVLAKLNAFRVCLLTYQFPYLFSSIYYLSESIYLSMIHTSMTHPKSESIYNQYLNNEMYIHIYILYIYNNCIYIYMYICIQIMNTVKHIPLSANILAETPKFRGFLAGHGDQKDQQKDFHKGLDEGPEPTHGSFTAWAMGPAVKRHGPGWFWMIQNVSDKMGVSEKWINNHKHAVYAWYTSIWPHDWKEGTWWFVHPIFQTNPLQLIGYSHQLCIGHIIPTFSNFIILIPLI